MKQVTSADFWLHFLSWTMAKSQAADGDAIHGKQCLLRTLEPACHGSDGCLGSVRALESCEEPEIYTIHGDKQYRQIWTVWSIWVVVMTCEASQESTKISTT